MLTIPNVHYTKCDLCKMLRRRNFTSTKCTIGNVTDPCKDIFLILFDDFTFVHLGVRIQQIIFFYHKSLLLYFENETFLLRTYIKVFKFDCDL